MKNRFIGIFVVAVVVPFACFIIYLLIPNDYPRLKFSKESMTSLSQGDPVKFNGVNIGEIERVKVADGIVEFDVKLEKEISIPRSAIVREEKIGLLGERMIQIRSNDNTGDVYSQDEAIPVSEANDTNRNVLGEIFASPEKIDTVIAILRRIESVQEICR